MTRDEFELYCHEIRLALELYRRVGLSFQDLFEQVMQKHDSSFVLIKPMGRVGDWKADGFSLNTGTVYQCYAPEDMTGNEAARKVLEDFTGARVRWAEKMQAWVFVWSSDQALPPQVVSVLADLKTRNPEISIDQMGREGLWRIVKELPLGDRIAILGPVPDLEAAPSTTAVEIQVLLKHLGKRTAYMPDDPNLDLTAIGEKLRRNGLSHAVINLVRPSIPVARLVQEYVTRMPDPAFSQYIALDLAAKYRALTTSTSDPDTSSAAL